MEDLHDFNRAWGFAELAMLYFPNILKKSASNQLRKWIKHSEKLMRQLLELGYRQYQKLLTPLQVQCIIKHLGEP